MCRNVKGSPLTKKQKRSERGEGDKIGNQGARWKLNLQVSLVPKRSLTLFLKISTVQYVSLCERQSTHEKAKEI